MGTIHKTRTTVGIGVLAAAAAMMLLGVAGGSGAMAGAVAKKQAAVTIKNFGYHKKTLKVAKGTKVVFRNKDRAVHTATKKGVFNTGRIKHGKAKAIVFKHKGTFGYICTVHPFMHGKIIVG
jgi:plastocyanin